MDRERDFCRHTLATVAYRASKALRGAPESFATFDGAGRTPAQILAHMGDLFDWALSISRGRQEWHDSRPLTWAEEKHRFFTALADFDRYLASGEPVQAPLDRLFQGPIADALTHVGQLAMMRRLAGNAASGENYYVAQIETGRVTEEQAAPVKEF